jgi:hypothetical protein
LIPEEHRFREQPGPWFEAGYLVWRIKKGPLPEPLITGGPSTTSGPLGAIDTMAFFGPGGLAYGTFSGGELAAGCWCDDNAVFGLEGRGFFLEQRALSRHFVSDANGNPALGVPFFNVDTMAQDFFDFAFPGATAGNVFVSSASRMWGAEITLLANLYRDPTCSFDLLGGFRYLSLREEIVFGGASTPTPGTQVAFGGQFLDPPFTTSTLDSFRTLTQFYGLTLGARADVRRGPWFAELTGQLGFGGNESNVDIRGVSALSSGAGLAATLPGGVLALPSNIGGRNHSQGSFVPELDVKVGYRVTKLLTAFVGYHILAWTDVARPGNQINHNVTTTQVPTSADFTGASPGALPQPAFHDSDFWAQGLTFGVEIHF